MNFIFECSTRYGVEHEKTKIISSSGHVIFCLLYKHTNNNVFDDFPRISDPFPKISEDFPKLFRRLGERLRTFFEHFSNIFRRLRKVAEDFRGGTDDISIIQHQLWVLFKRLCSYSDGNLKTCDNNLFFSHVKILYFYMWKYMDFLSGRNPNKTLVSLYCHYYYYHYYYYYYYCYYY